MHESTVEAIGGWHACALVLACASRAQVAPARDDEPEPERSVAIPALEVVSFDLLLSNFNRATSGSHDYDVSWHSVEHNLRGPWVVDNDPFSVNQFRPPLSGLAVPLDRAQHGPGGRRCATSTPPSTTTAWRRAAR